ncbi:Alpha/Beta hydrolase protein [Scheffersomyces amazonensis]|uniref:Alpha/Beta hydrolase protein n=1 Tax=Scheffersomyces amazonensis TaxID=1078765 RepID=UPI00315C87FE
MPLNPESSPYYTYSVKVSEASWPRFTGSVVLPTPSSDSNDYKLSIAYRRYETTQSSKKIGNKRPINLVFMHGNGMNKGLWHYHIDKIYSHYQDSLNDSYINVVLALDNANENDSAYINSNKLGPVYHWIDGTKDIIAVIKNNEARTFSQQNTINIIIGHSMGGFQSLMASIIEPNLFHAAILINPVLYQTEEYMAACQILYNKWIKHRRVVSQFKFDGPNKNWKKDVEQWFKTKSFFKNFHPQVLSNMIDDATPPRYDPNQAYDEINLKHPATQEYLTYFWGVDSVWQSMDKYKFAKVPIYHISTENDLAPPDHVKLTRELLKNVVIPIDVPKFYHSANAEQPDWALGVIYNSIDDVLAKSPGHIINDFKYKDILGKDYKDKLYQETFKNFIGDDFNQLKSLL